MLTHNGHKVVNFVRISPFTSNKNRQYILFTYGITWSEDYGRYTEYLGDLLMGHNGDVEKVIMAWEVVNNKTLILRHVFTSAHSNTITSHSGVWDPWHETEQFGYIAFWPDGQIMKATLEFVYISSKQSVLKVYASEDKHAIYPSESVGESVCLVYIPTPKPPLIGIPAAGVGWFIDEDVGGGPILRLPCYNIGEEDAHIIDDIGFLFQNERVWSGNIENPGRFAGGLDVSKGMGTIGGNLSGMPPMLEEVLNNQ
jgi:hypothetical protein